MGGFRENRAEKNLKQKSRLTKKQKKKNLKLSDGIGSSNAVSPGQRG